jgi:hypothetical protein
VKKKEKTSTAKPLPAQRLRDVLHALEHHRTAAIVFSYLAEHAADAFRGNDARGPTKLLALPNGLRCRADLNTVISVERVLRELAVSARQKADELYAAIVIVERTELVTETTPTVTPSTPTEDTVEDARGERVGCGGPVGTTSQ